MRVSTSQILRTHKGSPCTDTLSFIAAVATTAKAGANNTTTRNIKRAGRGYRNPWNYRSRILMVSAARTAA